MTQVVVFDTLVFVQILTNLSASQANEDQDDFYSSEYIQVAPKYLQGEQVARRVVGDSMDSHDENAIRHGEMVFSAPFDGRRVDGQLYYINYPGVGPMLKRWQVLDDGDGHWCSDNPDQLRFPPLPDSEDYNVAVERVYGVYDGNFGIRRVR